MLSSNSGLFLSDFVLCSYITNKRENEGQMVKQEGARSCWSLVSLSGTSLGSKITSRSIMVLSSYPLIKTWLNPRGGGMKFYLLRKKTHGPHKEQRKNGAPVHAKPWGKRVGDGGVTSLSLSVRSDHIWCDQRMMLKLTAKCTTSEI